MEDRRRLRRVTRLMTTGYCGSPYPAPRAGHHRGDRRGDLRALVATLHELTRRQHEVHVDLAEVGYCDLAGLRAIVRLADDGGAPARPGRQREAATHAGWRSHQVPGRRDWTRGLEIIGWDSAAGSARAGQGRVPPGPGHRTVQRGQAEPGDERRRRSLRTSGAKPPGLAAVEHRAGRGAGEQRPQGHGASAGPGEQAALQPPAQRGSDRQRETARDEGHAAPVGPGRQVGQHALRGRARGPLPVDLVQFRHQLQLDADQRQRSRPPPPPGPTGSGSSMAHRPPHPRTRRPGTRPGSAVGELFRAEAGELARGASAGCAPAAGEPSPAPGRSATGRPRQPRSSPRGRCGGRAARWPPSRGGAGTGGCPH